MMAPRLLLALAASLALLTACDGGSTRAVSRGNPGTGPGQGIVVDDNRGAPL